MTPDDLRAKAADLHRQASAALIAGDAEEARKLALLAAECDALAVRLAKLGLTGENNPGIIHDVTEAQIDRRGRAVAEAKAIKSGRPVRLAIQASQWKTLDGYAPRCKVSQGSLSKYINGKLPCPRPVARQVFKDFGLGDAVWPLGVVD